MSSLNCPLGVFLIYLNCFIQFDLMQRSQTTCKFQNSTGMQNVFLHISGKLLTVVWCHFSSPCSTSLLRPGCAEPVDPSAHLVAAAPHQPLTSTVWFSWCHRSEHWLPLDSGSSISHDTFSCYRQQGLCQKTAELKFWRGWNVRIGYPTTGPWKEVFCCWAAKQLLLFIFPIAHEAFRQRGSRAHLLILPQYHNRRKERERRSGKTLKTSAYFLHWWHTFAAILSFMGPSEKSYLLTVKLSIIKKSTFICLFVKCLQWLYRVNTVMSF